MFENSRLSHYFHTRINITLRNHKTKEEALVLSFRIDKEVSSKLRAKFSILKELFATNDHSRQTVSLNSFFGGGWDIREWRRSPLRAGDEFTIVIFIGDDEYLVSRVVNTGRYLFFQILPHHSTGSKDKNILLSDCHQRILDSKILASHRLLHAHSSHSLWRCGC